MSSIAHKEQSRRDLKALALTLLIHLIIAGVFILSHLILYSDVEEYRGPVLVKLGRADAPDEQTEKQPVIPENSQIEQAVSEPSEPEAAEVVKSGDPQDTVKVDESDSDTAVDRPVSDKEKGDLGDDSSASEQVTDQSRTVNEESTREEAVEPVTVTQGSEEGNAYETTYDASPGLVGRAFWIPIYMYMPVPQYVDKYTFDSIKSDEELENRPGYRTAEDKRKNLLQYYELTGDEYYLFNPPSEDERPQIWSILEDGSYDLKHAEYKRDKALRSVVLTFTVNRDKEETFISEVLINRSSGYGEIDDAVVYGFLKASFYNSSDLSVKGRFTYRFD